MLSLSPHSILYSIEVSMGPHNHPSPISHIILASITLLSDRLRPPSHDPDRKASGLHRVCVAAAVLDL